MLRSCLAWPVEGVLFDVKQDAFWYDGWGPQPPDPAEALALAQTQPLTVPAMVPVYSHRYLTAGRGTFDHVVLSIHQ